MCETSKRPGAAARGEVLGDDAAGVLERHLPAAEVDQLGAELAVTVEERGALQGGGLAAAARVPLIPVAARRALDAATRP